MQIRNQVMSDYERQLLQNRINELIAKNDHLEKQMSKMDERYNRAIDDVCWYHRELRKYIKQSKITERRIQDGKIEKR